MKVALVHDYLTQRGGAERVFELLCRRYPDADVFTSVYDAKRTIALGNRSVKTTGLQRLPGASRYFRLLVPFYYPAFQALDLKDYDLIISSTSSFAKGIRKRPGAKHICFCHNVTRFLWDTNTYLREYSTYRKFSPLIESVFTPLRDIDKACAQEPDLYIANSSTVAQRIKQIYGRSAIIVNYPIETEKFLFSEQKENFYLASARLLSYKRIDIIVEAFNWLGWNLVICGEGPERENLELRARENVKFLGYVSDAERMRLFSKAKAVIVAALEDYGLVPIEANASGTPVLSYGAGGVLDTQVPGLTGLFFGRQTPEAVHRALLQSQEIQWNYQRIRDHAINHFSEAVFFENIERIIQQALDTSPAKQDLDQACASLPF